MTWMMSATTLLTGISVIILAVLLAVYFRNLRLMKSKLLWGLILFTGVFLIQNIVSLYYFVTMMAYYVSAVELHVFILSLLQAIAFGVLLKITWD